MDSGLRRAWAQIVTADDYEAHMAAIGQAQAGAELAASLLAAAQAPARSHVVIAGAGTGQMFDFLDAAIWRRYRLTCTDLNPAFLARLKERLDRYGLEAELVADDFEKTALRAGGDLLLATLLLEHIDWHRGVDVISELRPERCGIVLQENPPGMATAVTPGRTLPASITTALEFGRPTLVPKEEFLRAMSAAGYECTETATRDVADGKRLIALLFRRAGDPHTS
jgi:hypothetical protein